MAMKKPRLRFFYLNGKLHKRLHVNRPADVVTTWCYDDGRVVKYNWSDTLQRYKPTFDSGMVAKMLNRRILALELAILEGKIPRPKFTYSIDEHRKMHKYKWSEENILAAHDYFSQVHYGRPRKDGLVTPKPLPTARELRAMINDEAVLFIKEGDKYVPTWKANI